MCTIVRLTVINAVLGSHTVRRTVLYYLRLVDDAIGERGTAIRGLCFELTIDLEKFPAADYLES